MTALPTLRHRTALLQTAPAAGMLLIHEIYRSLQGESRYAGWPCVFIRTAVCNLRCSWCDTPHAFKEGQWLAREEVLQRALAFQTPLVELTGGEPLLQAETLPLMRELCERGKTVLLETSGAADIAAVDPRVHIIMDLKCPDSGEVARNRWANLEVLKPSDAIKFVVASRRDFDWACEVIRQHRLDERFEVLFSAVFGAVPLVELAQWILASHLQVRMQLQMHKYIWDPKARGV